MHDMGAIAKTKVVDGKESAALRFTSAAVLARSRTRPSYSMSFFPKKSFCRCPRPSARVFARLGEKRNRARARVKFLIANLGIDEFRKLVLAERQKLAHDPRWTAHLASVNEQTEEPLKPGVSLNGSERPDGFDAWYATNVYKQRQPGYEPRR